MRKVLFAVALVCAAGCSGSSTSHEDPVTAGPGIKIDPSTHAIGIDDSRVPMMPACAAGQIVRRGADGWECGASAPDSARLGGKPAASYLTTDATAANASNLEGRPASFFLAAAAQAADSAMLGGVPAASYQLAASPAVDSLKLGGLDAAAYQLASAPAANAKALNGHPDTFFLPAAAAAADSAKLGGIPASSYQLASVPASNALQLGGVAAASYLRKDVASQSVAAPFSIVSGSTQVASFDAKGGFTVGPVSSSSNVSVAGQINVGKDVNVKGTVFTTNVTADGDAHVVGDVAAGSFNGLDLFRKSGSNASCNTVCGDAKGTCVAARITPLIPIGASPFAARCDAVLPVTLPFNVSCYCAAFE